MDWLFWAKRWVNIMERWPSTRGGPLSFLSLFWEKVKVGCWWFGGSEVNYQLSGRPLRLILVGYYMDKVLWARIWSPLLLRWPSLTGGANLFLSLFREKVKVGCWWLGGSEVNYQLSGRPLRLILVGYYMDKVLWARIWSPLPLRWPSLTGGANLFLSLYREKAKRGLGWSVANVSKGSCPRST